MSDINSGVGSVSIDGLSTEVFNALTIAQAYAATSNSTAQEAIMGIQNAVSSHWPVITETELTLVDIGTQPTAPTPIDIRDISLYSDDFSFATPTCGDIGVEIPEVPPFSGERPGIFLPDIPTDEFKEFTETPPNLPDVVIPNNPGYTLPPVPTINDITVPPPPSYVAPVFDATEPIEDLTPPTEFFTYHEGEYNSEVKEALIEKVLYDIKNGGTGLNQELEQAIWNRAKSRQKAENEKAYLAIQNAHAASGFNRCRGVTDMLLAEERERIRQAELDLNRDILVQSSDLAQKNTWFAIEQAINYEKSLMEHANQVAQRAFETAKTIVELANSTYATLVEAYKIKMEAYKIKAEVYNVQIQSEIAKAEFYKAQIEGLKVSAEINDVMVRAYVAQCEGIKTLISMYSVEMEAAKVSADINKTQIEIFRTKAEVFKINTDALIVKYNAYQTQIAGEAEKVKLYLADSQVYESQIKGIEAVANIANAKADLVIKKYQGEIETYKTKLGGFQTTSQVSMEQARTEAAIQGLTIEAYKAENSAYVAALDAHLKSYIAKIEESKAIASISVKEAELVLNSQMSAKEISVSAMTNMAKVSSQMAAAALTAVNASMSLGESATNHASNSASLSESRSQSESSDMTKGVTTHSESISENYNYSA